jgi:hypothetical protein
VSEPFCFVYVENGEEYFAPKGAYVPDNAQPLYTTPPAQPAPKVVDCHATGVCVQSGLRAEMPAPVPVCKECNGSGEIETGIGMMACTDCPPAQPAPNCTRSHPHENMDAMCELRTEIARLTNENARLKAAQQEKIMPMTDDHGKAIQYQYRVIDRRGNWFLLYDQHQLGNAVVHEFRIQKLKHDILLFRGITLDEAQKRFAEKVEADNE